MEALNSKERIERILNLEPVDRVGVFENFWPETVNAWKQQGHLDEDESPWDHFGYDISLFYPFNTFSNIDAAEEILEENDQSVLVRTVDLSVIRRWKDLSGTPEHVDFAIKSRKDWDEFIRPYLVDEGLLGRRIDFEGYRKEREKCNQQQLFFCSSGVNVFECIHPVAGHMNILMSMALDPDWIKDMCDVYSNLIVKMQSMLFEREGAPDGIWFYEDMGFKGKPFMSPKMYRDIVWPAHKKTVDFAHSLGCKVIVHSCGYVEPLMPDMIDAGFDCLQALEVKAGMDLINIKKQFGDKIALCGGMDIRCLETNDNKVVDELLRANLADAKHASGYILHSDHSISKVVNYETYKHFLNEGLRLGNYDLCEARD
jgi:uroporphyrinogen decarboxylase